MSNQNTIYREVGLIISERVFQDNVTFSELLCKRNEPFIYEDMTPVTMEDDALERGDARARVPKVYEQASTAALCTIPIVLKS